MNRLKYWNMDPPTPRETLGATSPPEGSIESLLSDHAAQQLVRAAQAYDDYAVTHLYQLFADRIFRYLLLHLGDRNHAEELTSEVFVRVLEKIHTFRPSPHGQALALTGWIYRIAHNLMIDDLRRLRARGPVEPLDEELYDVREPEDSLEFHLNQADLELALRRLTRDQRTVIMLRFEEGWTSAEIAKLLGKTEGAIKALQHRGLAALALWLGTTPASGHAEGEATE